ncbi:hypothetical protein ACTXT7_017376 [Hymenolepis weldensis]
MGLRSGLNENVSFGRLGCGRIDGCGDFGRGGCRGSSRDCDCRGGSLAGLVDRGDCGHIDRHGGCHILGSGEVCGIDSGNSRYSGGWRCKCLLTFCSCGSMLVGASVCDILDVEDSCSI